MCTQIFSVLLRVISIIFVVVGMVQLSNNFYFIFSTLEGNAIFQLSYLILFISPFFIALILYVFSTKIAQALMKNVEDSKKLSDTTLNEMQSAAISIVGIIFLAFTLDRLLSVSIFLYRNKYGMDVKIELLFALVITVINIVVGLFLVFGSKGLIELINRFRNTGLDK
jgi:hypothetical protein